MGSNWRRLFVTALGACFCLAGLASFAPAARAKDWPLPTGDYANWRYSPLNQINKDNVGSLRVAWSFSTGVLRGHEGAPLVVDGMMYVHTPFPNQIMALDLAKDGEVRWIYRPKQDTDTIPVMCCDTVHRGAAYADGMIFFQQADTTVVALDAKGDERVVWATAGQRHAKEVWKAVNGDIKKGETNTGAVMPVKDKLIVGLSGGEFGVRCHVTAYDLHTGKQVWRAYAVGPDADLLINPDKTTHLGKPVGPDSSLKSWEGDQWKIGGGCAWGWYSYDPQLNLIYYGTGNPSVWNAAQRPGDNRWTATIWARDADTGEARWVYQMTPHDEWDFDGTGEMILADLEFDGVKRRCLVHFDKNGFAYVLDRGTGELLSAEKYDPTVNWASRIVMDKSSPDYGRPLRDARYSAEKHAMDEDVKGVCPANIGAKNQQPAAFNPKNGVFYAPTNHLCMDYSSYKASYTAGYPYVGATTATYAAPEIDHPAEPADFRTDAYHKGPWSMGKLIAWDPIKAKVLWSKPERFTVWSGVLVTAGDLIFYGTLEGYVKALDLEGRELFKFKTPSGIVGNFFTYEFEGKQYVGVFSGVGGWAGLGLAAGFPSRVSDTLCPTAGCPTDALEEYTRLGGSLTVFSLP